MSRKPALTPPTDPELSRPSSPAPAKSSTNVSQVGTEATMTGSKGSGLAVGVAEQYASDLLRKASSATSTPASTNDGATDVFKLGDRVWVGGSKPGVIAFMGETKFAAGEWAGVILDDFYGKNDGSVTGVRYFTCEPLKGVFAKAAKLTRHAVAEDTGASASSGPSAPVPGKVSEKRPVHVDAPVKAEEAQEAESKSRNVVDSMPTSELSSPESPEASEGNETLYRNSRVQPSELIDEILDISWKNKSKVTTVSEACGSSAKRTAELNEGGQAKIPKLSSSPFEQRNAIEKNPETTIYASSTSYTTESDNIFHEESHSSSHCDDVVYTELEMPDTSGMKHIVFLDLDNVPNFFEMMPFNLPDNTFIWIFRGGKNVWKPPSKCGVYVDAEARGLTHIQQKSGTTKNAADFDICAMVGYSHAEITNKSLPFTILSNDLAFEQLEKLFKGNRRKVTVIKPLCHDKVKLFNILKSISEAPLSD